MQAKNDVVDSDVSETAIVRENFDSRKGENESKNERQSFKI